MQHISPFNRLRLCLREFWELNYKKILSIPLVILIFFLLLLLWPGNYLYTLIFNPKMAESPGYFLAAMESGYGRARVIILCLIPIFLILVSNSYLKSLKTSVSYAVRPFSNLDRVFCLWIYALFIIGLSIFSVYLYDIITVSVFKSTYYDKTLILLEEQGNLYPKFQFGSFFMPLDAKIYFAVSGIILLLLPFYHLAYFLFQKNSLLWSVLLYILIIVGSIYIYVKFIINYYFIIPFHPVITSTIYGVMVCIVLALFVASFKEKLKEREV
ncbi:hypothetical protein [Sphingobacterium wenxiniae]|uniref:ABC-2 family transporter protein n=1 Tax=Sphingobacterium wenxiniae TaxID=683125 RepID=A0A1I6TWG0_9SPHI|nr:hypothetical protein [Sphingobacterium wenxiniae]SFS93337.1 hypothetical protein SAMN05660206_10781 [Sphingobacterium wenxiniae]